MTWHVWTDGSCQHGLEQVPRGLLGWGGWAAIVEHGSDGSVLRGRVPQTTNVRMELVAAIEALRFIPEGESVTLWTDCTTLQRVHTLARRNDLRELVSGDADLWLELAIEYDLHSVAVHVLGRGVRPAQHRRAHGFAGAEARSGLRDLPLNVTVEKIKRRDVQRTAIANAFHAHHTPACTETLCFHECPVWRARHPHLLA